MNLIELQNDNGDLLLINLNECRIESIQMEYGSECYLLRININSEDTRDHLVSFDNHESAILAYSKLKEGLQNMFSPKREIEAYKSDCEEQTYLINKKIQDYLDSQYGK